MTTLSSGTKTMPPSRPNYVPNSSGVIWSMWWQGEENCPEVVKLCWASMRKHCGSHKLIIITKDNYQDYVTIPEYILAKVEAGSLLLAHLADIIRVNLLAKYGGLWLDSTIFVAKEIPEEVFSMEFFTIKRVKDHELCDVRLLDCYSPRGVPGVLPCM